MAGASWDYKQIGFEDFGNFNYGATGAAVGWSRAELAFGSLWAHVRSDPLRVYGRTKIGQRGESNHAADVSANA